MSTYEVGSEGNRKRQSRTGKIARLPHDVREEVNRRLRDNQPGEKICKWLNRLPAAKAVCKEFAGRRGGKDLPIAVNHLSEWRRGGYQDWLREQQMLEGTREMARWSAKLAKESGGDLSEGAAVLLSGQLLRLLEGMAMMESGIGNIEHRMERAPEPSAPPDQEESKPSPLRWEREKLLQRREEKSQTDRSHCCGQECPRSGAEQMEASVRVLRELVKCLWGIRNGDHNRVRLAQVDRKLAQRDKMIALEREKYDDEQAEIRAGKKAKEEERLEEERKSKIPSPLDDAGKIDLIRGKLFGPDSVVAEREAELERLQKELEYLKAAMPPSRRAGKGDGESNVAVVSDTAVASGVEPIRANTSASDQSQGKNGTGGGSEADFSTPPSSLRSDATRRREDAKAQGPKKFDVKEMLREVRQIDEELAALAAQYGGPESDVSTQGRKETEAQGAKDFEDEDEEDVKGSGIFDPDAVLRELKKFDKEAALRELEEIKKEVAVLKARRQAESANGGKDTEGNGGAAR